MTSKKSVLTDSPLLVIRVEMEYFEDVTRRLRVPAHFTLDRLHEALQVVFEFFNYHLHQFIDPRSHIYTPMAPSETAANLDCPAETVHSTADTPVGALLRKEGDEFLYDYDFGDGWRFYLKLECTEPAPDAEAAKRIVCLDGTKSGPPEDCGGPPGFDNLKKVLKKKRRSADDKDLLAWLEEMRPGYDPDAFDLEKANRALAVLGKRPSDGKHGS